MGLYVFFKTVCDYYGLVPEDNYTIPAEAEGVEPNPDSRSSLPPMILKREPSEPGAEEDNSTMAEGVTDHTLSTAGTTKRHRHSPSVGATAISMVVEEAEEEDDSKEQTRPVSQIFESTPKDNDGAEGGETAEPTAEAEAEAAASAANVPDADPAEDVPEKQSASNEAKADPAPRTEEKQSVDEEASKDAEEAKTADANVPDTESTDADEVKEDVTDGGEAQKSKASTTAAMDSETVEKKADTATEASDKPAEDTKPEG